MLQLKNMDTEEKKLIESFSEGNGQAFESLMEKYLKPVYNFVYQLTKNQAVTDDLTQETFLKAWKNIKRFDKSKSFKTWIFSIAKNTTYDYFKKKKEIPFSFFEDEDGGNKLENVSEEKNLPNEILYENDLKRGLESSLDKIPEKYKLILVMHYRDDFSLLEISQILKIPYNTAKSSHSRALKRLKEVVLSEKRV